MANPRRNSTSNSSNHQISIQSDNSNNASVNLFKAQTLTTTFSSLKFFMKKPHACPFLLCIFLLLAWICLRFQHYYYPHQQHQQQQTWTRDEVDEDRNANLIRFASSSVAKDKRGWLLDPISVAADAAIPGGVRGCASLHVGEIQPGSMRGNHRHHTCNETFLIWGAKTKFRLQNNEMEKGYAEVIIGADEIGVIGSPCGTAHALLNLDPVRTTFFLGCQDAIVNYSNSTDFNVWKDL